MPRVFWIMFMLLAAFSLRPEASIAQTALPPDMLNHNLLPTSPEAAALGRFGEVPVSLYTGVPSVSIPLFTLPGRTVSVPLSLQYHGGGVRPDQVSPWTGMSWTLNAGGAIVRTCRGIDDFDVQGYPYHAAPLPEYLNESCYNGSTDGTGADPLNYYQYLTDVFEGRLDTQPDLFSFNFMGYSGKIIFDQYGTPYTTPSQPLKIVSPLTSGTGGWELTTPDGTQYMFTAAEITNIENSVESPASKSGASAWFLTRITTAQHEMVNFIYQDYTTHINYLYTDLTNTIPRPAMSTQTVVDQDKHPILCNELNARDLKTSIRPTTHIRGKYLSRIVSATHCVELVSSANRPDQPGMRRLDAVRLKYLPDSARYQEVRFQYGDYAAPADRLFLQQVQRFGVQADGRQLTEPPYLLTYVPPFYTSAEYAGPARGTHAIDRWGYYNAAPNRWPFPRDNRQTRQVLAAVSRETNPAAVTFGLLSRIQYPTGGVTTLEFESHDFSNANEASYTETLLQRTACLATAGAMDCGAQTDTVSFVLTHAQTVHFKIAISSADGEPVGEFDGYGTLFDKSGKQIARIEYLKGRAPGGDERTISLPPGRYRLQAIVAQPRALQVSVAVNYAQRFYTDRKWRGGGTRIKRISTYDGQDHMRDQVKEYYYDTDNHTVSTGRLIHQPVFHSTYKYIIVPVTSTDETGCAFTRNVGDPGGQFTCHYIVHFAEDIAASNGSAQGSAVGYDTVSVVQRSGQQTTRTTSVFFNLAAGQVDFSDQANQYQGFISNDFYEQNGLELLTLDYAVREGGDPFRSTDIQLVRRVAQTFGIDSIPDKKILGLSIEGSLGELPRWYPTPCRGAVVQSYYTTVGWWPLTLREEMRYDDRRQPMTTTTRLLYRSSAHYQPYSQEVTVSNGLQRSTRYKYALDYAPTADAGVQQLQARYMVTTPVEMQQWVQQPGKAARWLGGQLTQFTTTADGVVVPRRVYQAALAAPASGLTEPRSAAGYTSLVPGSGVYQPQAEFSYGPAGVLREQAVTAGSPTAYVWGYGNLHPIAEIKNATAAQVAYTSFEAGELGRWQAGGNGGHLVATSSYTGQASYQLTATSQLSCLGVPVGSYRFSCWLRNGGGAPTINGQNLLDTGLGFQDWKLFQAVVPVNNQGNITLVGSCQLDEVRLHPVGTQLTTLTYDPLFGTSSQTGPDGRTIFYEYDALGRLLRVRDEQNRVLSENEYRYARP
ncbi:RHS repeat domain-containing protein [Hymenobacter rubripertinctus]|uniref:RHS repeat protein n=1 Tax=Hymenobacter rubripertinctus TaxID=2029981 RepID=A0A418R9X3_9BACT|nr:RHS repeat protein [Hymenobacter rubripertinctus]RIY14111.1 hypothetical protein D0T11_00010 [Hymenobacter rubripertinctus]